MAVKKKGLGRGLDALFPEKSVKPAEKKPEQKPVATNESLHQQEEGSLNASAVKSAAETKDTAQAAVVEEPKKSEMLVKISKVEPNRTQPRKQFDEDALLELSESIKQFGILQPLLVSDKGDYYEIIAGERRWRAAKLAGLKEVPVIIKEFNDQQVVEISLIENIQREDLNPIEEAMAYKRLIDEFKLKQDNIAERVSKSRTAVTNSLRLLKLDERVQQMLIDEMISAGHARAILAITDKDKQTSVAMKIFDEKLSVVGLLNGKLSEMFAESYRQDAYVTELFGWLKQLKTGKTLSQVVKEIHEDFDEKKKTEKLGKAQEHMLLDVIKTLESYEQISKAEHLEAEAEFERVREEFKKEPAKLEQQIENTTKALDNAFDFMEEAFGQSQEMVVFVTELNVNYYSVWFIKENGCDKYYQYNRGLLFDEQQAEIMAEMDELERKF